MENKKYKIFVNSPITNRQLVYTVKDYEIVDNYFIRFYDEVKDKIKLFPLINVEIEELQGLIQTVHGGKNKNGR